MAAAAQQVMLAQKYDDKIDPTNWWMSEKLDGVRAYWSGSKFYSRQGNEFLAPAWFTKDLPREPLDGELWCGRGLFQKTLSIIKKTKDVEKHAADWKYVTYLVFDAPQRSQKGMKYEQRVAWLEANIQPQSETTYAAVVGVCKCTGRDHLTKLLKQVLVKGGEGIMLRQPNSLYENTRSHTLLKVKYFHSEEAKVTGHEKGSGRCSNMTGKIHCVLPTGVAFKIGTGFSDAQRKNPPKIGSVVEFKFQELSDHGKYTAGPTPPLDLTRYGIEPNPGWISGHPRFPVFLRERGDLSWADVLAAAKVKAPFSSIKKKAVPLLQKQHSILFSTIPSRDQDSGKKVVTSNDADDDADEELKKGLLLTKGNAAPSSAAAAGGAGSVTGKKRGAGAASSKPLCKFHPKCFRKNKEHLEMYDHPPPEEGGDADDDDADELDGPEPRNGDMPDDPADPDYVDGPAGKKKKRARTDKITSPGAAAAAAASPTASPSKAPASPSKAPAQKACYYGAACYNKDPDHVRRFSHPPPPPPPRTKEEFIETTNHSQADLAEYYKFGGDEEEEEVAEILAADRNERRLSIQKFNENNAGGAGVEADDDEDDAAEDVRTVVTARPTNMAAAVAAHQKANGDFGYFKACASDDDDEDGAEAKTVLVKDLPKTAPQPVRVATTASSSAATVVPRTTRQASARLSSGAVAPAPAASAASASASPPPSAASCPFILPELLAKHTRIIETEDGDELCKRCKQPVGDHRESR